MERKNIPDNFYKRITILAFAVVFVISFLIFDYCTYESPLRGYIHKLTVSSGMRFGADEIEPAIFAMQEQDCSTKLLLGDSVAHQLFAPLMYKNSDFLVYPTNASLTTAGQYILARIYLENHPDATDIYLVMYPGSLANGINTSTSYQYLAIPFIENGYTNYLDGPALDGLRSTYGSVFLNPKVMRYVDYSGINRKLFFNWIKIRSDKEKNIDDKNSYDKNTNDNENYISDLSIYYLKALYQLGQEKNVNIHLISDPVADIAIRHEEQDSLREIFASSGLQDMYPNYCDSIIFCPEGYYLEDEVHFNEEHHNRETLNPLIEQMAGLDDSVYNLIEVFQEN